MADFIECLECQAPGEYVASCDGWGIDYDGREAIFIIQKFECAAGHRYHVIEDKDVVKL